MVLLDVLKCDHRMFTICLTRLQVIWIGVFQYCFIRVIMTVIAVAAESVNLYCEDSDNVAFAHIWVWCFQ